MNDAHDGPRLWTPAEVRLQLASIRKHRLAFGGFGELGYADTDVVRRIMPEVLGEWRHEDLLLIGGTMLREGGNAGIAVAFEIASDHGIETVAIHPGIALRFADTHRVSPFAEHVFFIDDDSWGGMDSTGRPSPTLQTLLSISDEFVAIGGGVHTADEIRGFAGHGRTVRYFPAEMNHEWARRWADRAGADLGHDRGAAFEAWSEIQRGSDP
jgi:hypothetical protein